jgi:hypothetical protein
MAASNNDREALLAQAIDLINDAKLETKEEKHYKLAQVLEMAMHRDPSLLPDVVPMVVEFQVIISEILALIPDAAICII